ncbi:MAG: type II toxin-antitoxin system MqsA family antitoxin [Gammaproteobacteria bacterium]|nr:type II toxin-antitoxin system MqsA family antitoxin [Gammaproteobacteria bacterium]
MKDKKLCPVCGEGKLSMRQTKTELEYCGKQATLPILFAECDVCGSEIARDEESRANKRTVLRFHKQVSGLLSGGEIRAIREQYNLTQTLAAKLLGGPTAFSKYENDDAMHSEAMDNLLRLMRRSEEAFWELAAEKQMTELLPLRPRQTAHYSKPVEKRPLRIGMGPPA